MSNEIASAFTPEELRRIRRDSADHQARKIVGIARYSIGGANPPPIYTVVRHRTPSGATVEGFVMGADGFPFYLRGLAAEAGMRFDDVRGGNRVRSGGMSLPHAWWESVAHVVERLTELNDPNNKRGDLGVIAAVRAEHGSLFRLFTTVEI